MHVESSKNDTNIKNLNFVWCWVHSWFSMYPSDAWVCACIDQNCIEQGCVCVRFCEVYQIGPTRVISTLLWFLCRIWRFGIWWIQFNPSFISHTLPFSYF
jgi:hypothetical protein